MRGVHLFVVDKTLFIQTESEDIDRIDIYTSDSKLLLSRALGEIGGTIEIPLNTLQKGAYIAVLHTTSGSKVGRFVLQ